MKHCQIDLWPAQCHATAVSLIEHPVRQLTAKVRPLLRVDTPQILAAPKGRYLKRATEQRVPPISDPRKPQTVCRMSRVGRGGRGTRTDHPHSDRDAAPLEPARQDCSSHGACRSHPLPARREPQMAGQSSTQHSHHPPQRRQADITPNLHRCPVRQRDLDLAIGHLCLSGHRQCRHMLRIVARGSIADRPHGEEYWQRFRPEHPTARPAAPVPQQATADLISPRNFSNARTRLLSLRDDLRKLTAPCSVANCPMTSREPFSLARSTENSLRCSVMIYLTMGGL